MTLILLRHATVTQLPGVPAALWQLSDAGRQRCRQFAHQLRPYAPELFVTSEEPKAAETGNLLAAELERPLRSYPNLHEHDRTTVPYFDSDDDFRAAVARFFREPEQLVFGSETAGAARRRFGKAVQDVLVDADEGNVVIVAHGTVLTLYICHFNPTYDPLTIWQSLTMPGGAVLTTPGFRLQAQLSF